MNHQDEIFEALFDSFKISSIVGPQEIEKISAEEIVNQDFASTTVFILQVGEVEQLLSLPESIRDRLLKSNSEDFLKNPKVGIYPIAGIEYFYYLVIVDNLMDLTTIFETFQND